MEQHTWNECSIAIILTFEIWPLINPWRACVVLCIWSPAFHNFKLVSWFYFATTRPPIYTDVKPDKKKKRRYQRRVAQCTRYLRPCVWGSVLNNNGPIICICSNIQISMLHAFYCLTFTFNSRNRPVRSKQLFSVNFMNSTSEFMQISLSFTGTTLRIYVHVYTSTPSHLFHWHANQGVFMYTYIFWAQLLKFTDTVNPL